MDDFDQAVEQYHDTVAEVLKGHPEPTLQMWSQREDVVLCNPFHPFAHGPSEVAQTTNEAASHFAGGACESQLIEKQVTAELGYIIELEQWRTQLDGKDSAGALRVTTIFRREDGAWRVVHRHADPITTPQSVESMVRE
jgi:ketosteroid isomerase-like protein